MVPAMGASIPVDRSGDREGAGMSDDLYEQFLSEIDAHAKTRAELVTAQTRASLAQARAATLATRLVLLNSVRLAARAAVDTGDLQARKRLKAALDAIDGEAE
jgi:hypothetical protein